MLALAAITLVGAAFRFATLDLQSFWNDEVFSAWYASRPFHEMLRGVRATESTPPGYYVAAWLWAKVFGTGEFGLRSLSALAGTAMIPTTYATAATLVSRRAGLLTAALAATSPVLVWYSQEARSYGLMVLATSLSMLFFARAIERGRTRDLAAWALLSSLAVWIHYFAVFPIIAEAVFLLVLQRARRAVLGALAAAAACSAVAIPLMRQQTGRASWIHDIPLDTRIEETIRQLVTAAPASPWAGAGSAGSGTQKLWWLAAIVLTAAVVAAIRFGSSRTRRGVILALGIGGAAIVIPLVGGSIAQVIAGRGDYLIERNVLAAWLPLAIVVAAGLGTPRMGSLGLGTIAVLCAAGAAVVMTIIANPLWQRDDWRLLVRRLPAGPIAVLVVPTYQSTPVRYYDRSLGPAAAPVRTREIIVVSSGNTAGDAIRLPRAFTFVSTERAGRWELRRLRSKAPALVSPQPGLLVRTS